MIYTITEKLAYSKCGKVVATMIRDKFFQNCRVHWVQQAIAEMSFAKLS